MCSRVLPFTLSNQVLVLVNNMYTTLGECIWNMVMFSTFTSWALKNNIGWLIDSVKDKSNGKNRVLIIQSPWGIDIQHSILSTISVSLRFIVIKCCHTLLLPLIHPSNLAWSAFLPVIRIHFEFSHFSSDSHQPGLSCQPFSPADSSNNLLQRSLLSLVLFYSLCLSSHLKQSWCLTPPD